MKPPSLASQRLPNLASQMRIALASMAWNTGSNSPGDELMTRSTSDVAVCCSSDSVRSVVRWRNSLSSRVFSMAMTAWAAKFCQQFDLFVGEWPHFLPVNRNGADQFVFLEHRNHEQPFERPHRRWRFASDHPWGSRGQSNTSSICAAFLSHNRDLRSIGAGRDDEGPRASQQAAGSALMRSDYLEGIAVVEI